MTTQPKASALARSTWATILERDVDLVLLDLLHTSEAFRHWLLKSASPDLISSVDAATFVGAWHSVNTPNGESDVEAEWVLPDGRRLVVLIEDKIAAAFQPEQGIRYRARAEGYVASGRATMTRTILTAPGTYAARDPAGAEPFERHLSLESVRDWCRSADAGERGSYLARFLDHALRRSSAGARFVPHGADTTKPGTGRKKHYPELYAVIQRVIDAQQRDLPLSVGNSSPGEWVYLRFDGQDGASMRWRLSDHWVELVLSSERVSRNSLERALFSIPLPGAAVSDRGRTEHVVWVPTPELDLSAPAEIQTEAITRALSIAGELAQWYLIVMPRLIFGGGFESAPRPS